MYLIHSAKLISMHCTMCILTKDQSANTNISKCMEQPQNATGGRTVLQIHVFVQHALEQDIPKSVEASDIYTIDRSGLYGADENGPIPSAELQQVIVPRSSIVLDTNIMHMHCKFMQILCHI